MENSSLDSQSNDGVDQVAKETVKDGVDQVAKETVKDGVDQVAKETVKDGVDQVAKETTVKEMISRLPHSDRWRGPMSLCLFEGHWTFPFYVEGTVWARTHFQPQPSDVIVCSPPKTGTTWLKSLAFAIMTRSSMSLDDHSTNPLLTKMPHDFIPILEADLAFPSTHPEPRKIPLLATHIPYASLPESIKDSDCKLVYICRDPKDSFVSLYLFFARYMESKHAQLTTIEEAFELFCEGESWSGPYWDHVLGFWRASLEQPKKILFFKYEEMRVDTVSSVKKLAEFIGYPFSSEEEENGLVEKIVKMCSFENLSNLEVNKNGIHREGKPEEIENKLYFRKGKVGDWENWLTPQMVTRIDQITYQKLQGSGLTL